MADVNKSIKADGTGDYTTIIAFEAAITSNAAADSPWIGTINDTSTYTGALTFNVSNTNNAQHVIKAGASFGHGGAFASGGQISVSAGNAIAIATNNVTFEGFAVSTSVINAAMIFISGASTDGVILKNMMCRHTATTGSTSYGVYVFSYKAGGTITINGGCYVTRSTDTSGNNLVFASAAYNVALTNISALNMGSGAKTVFVGALATLTAINCAAYNNASATNSGFGYTLQSGSDRNCTDDGGGNVGTNPQTTTDGSTFFVSQTSGSEDLHKLAALVNTLLGTDALVASVDIDGQTRIAGKCDIGADMLYPAAPTVDATPAPNATYTVGDAYSVDHAFTGTGSGTWDVSAGAVPSGTSIAGATGIVSGTLTTAESVSYTARVTDAWGQTGTRQFTTTINAPVVAASSGKQGLTLGQQLGLSILFCLAMFITGCTTNALYESPDHVSIYHRGNDSQGVELYFKSPTDDSHLIQTVAFGWRDGVGVESFRSPLPPWQRDRHSSSAVREQRTMTICPGVVEGQAETPSGFAMLESDWPPNFNVGYRQWYPIRGRIVSSKPQHATTYIVTWEERYIKLSVGGKTFTWSR